jgi:hypothetical protein
MIKDFIEIRDYTSLDDLIERLTEVRDSLPEGADATMKLQGCDVFGRTLSISYFRPQTEEEAACDARYANAFREAREREAVGSEELAVGRPPKGRQLRAVA